jgi:activator of 2-hydroxyglutaryl-CoA dehydratase
MTQTKTKKVEYWRWPEETWVNPDIDWKAGKFVTAGIDVGSVSTQAVIMVDGKLYAYSNQRTGSDSPESATPAAPTSCTGPRSGRCSIWAARTARR